MWNTIRCQWTPPEALRRGCLPGLTPSTCTELLAKLLGYSCKETGSTSALCGMVLHDSPHPLPAPYICHGIAEMLYNGTTLSMVNTCEHVVNADDITVARPSGLREARPTTHSKSRANHLRFTCSSLATHLHALSASFRLLSHQMHSLLSACSRKHVIEAAPQLLQLVPLQSSSFQRHPLTSTSLPDTFTSTTIFLTTHCFTPFPTARHGPR
jgi:hypothetical protein